MTYAVVLTSSLLAVVLTLALAREVRLRKALQRLLAKIFIHGRTAHATDPPNRSPTAQGSPLNSAGDDRM
jgi:hypothetical protein